MTLVGPAGIGKTRLALAFAGEHSFVRVVDDANVHDAAGDAVLATAREPLHVSGERVYRVRPLAEAPAVELYRALAGDARTPYAELALRVAALGGVPAAIVDAARSQASS